MTDKSTDKQVTLTGIIRFGEVDKNFDVIAPGAIDTLFPILTMSEALRWPAWSLEIHKEDGSIGGKKK